MIIGTGCPDSRLTMEWISTLRGQQMTDNHRQSGLMVDSLWTHEDGRIWTTFF